MDLLKKINIETITITLLLVVVSYFVFFLKLNAFQIRPWDEAIYANSAFEMWKSGNAFMLLRNGLPDLYNSKPLLPIWLEVISFRIFGFNELAVRLPSAIAATCTAIGLFSFIREQFNSTWAWTSFFVLVTSLGFIHFHAARTGDMDALLTVFLSFSFFYFFKLINEEKINNRNIMLFMVFLACAIASKTFAAILFLPAQIILLVIYRKIIPLLKNPTFYVGIAAVVVIGILPLLLRNIQQPGYLTTIFHSDAIRLSNVLEGHSEPVDFYLNNFFGSRFSIWIIFSFIGFILMIRSAEPQIRKLGIATFACFLSYLLIISFSATKLEWYDVPLYPLLAIAGGYAIHSLLSMIHIEKFTMLGRLGIIVFAFSIPLNFAIKNSMSNDIDIGDRKAEELATYLFIAGQQNLNLNNWCVIQNQHFSCLDFYRNKMSEQKKVLRIISITDSLFQGDHVLTENDSAKKIIRDTYQVKEEDRYNNVVAFEILSLKKQLQVE